VGPWSGDHPGPGSEAPRDAAASGLIEAFCLRHDVRVLTVFGSACRGDDRARDLDVGVLTERGVSFDAVVAIGDLVELTGTDAVDLAQTDPMRRLNLRLLSS